MTTISASMENNNNRPDRALVLMAHPDDPEFGAGGTVARWAAEGTRVSYAIVTDGSKGSNDPEMTPENLVDLRKAEQRAAAKTLGVEDVHFLDFPDGAVFNDMALRLEMVRLIRSVRPQVLVTHDPTARLIDDARINHPDHLAVGDTALNAVYPFARDRLTFPQLLDEGLEPYKVLEVYLAMSANTNLIVDISATFDKKIKALLAHKSQIGEPVAFVDRMRRWYADLAAGTPFRYVERFRRIVLNR